MKRNLVLLGLTAAGFAVAYGATTFWNARPSGPPGMVWIPGGEFTMGSDAADASVAEKPAHRVRVDGFWIDETDVTNAQFRAFVEATGYVTTAERTPTVDEIMAYAPRGQAP